MLEPLRSLVSVATIVCVIAGAATAQTAETNQRVLKLFTWSEYMPDSLVEEFERDTGTDIQLFYYETDEQRDVELAAAQGRGYDLILVSGGLLPQYFEQGWVVPLDPSQLRHLADAEETWISVTENGLHRGQPFAWGTLGIGFRADLVNRPLRRWKDLFQPGEDLQGRIIMINDSWDLLSAALFAVGAEPENPDRSDLRAAEQLLMAQKPSVARYGYPTSGEDSALLTGEAVAAMLYNGHALVLQEANENVRYVVPEEGTLLWVDYWALSAFARNEAAAQRFLSFLGEKRNAAKVAEELYQATPYRSVYPLLSDELRKDPVVYPSPEVLSGALRYREVNLRTVRLRSEIFNRVTR